MARTKAVVEVKTYYFTPEQKEQLMRVVYRPVERVALELGFALGTRVSEVLTLMVEDVDFGNGWVRVPDVKKKDIRIVPIPPYVLELVAEYIRQEKLKPMDQLLSYSSTTLNNWLKSAAERAGIEPEEEEGNIRWHSLRGSFIRWHQDLPLKMVEQLTGDRYDTLMQYYQEYRPADIKKALREKWSQSD